MFHFWFNTCFVEEEEEIHTTVSNGGQLSAPATPPTNHTSTPFAIRWGSGRGKYTHNTSGTVASSDSDKLSFISSSLVHKPQTMSADQINTIRDPLHRNGQYEHGGSVVTPHLTSVQKLQASAAELSAPPTPRYYKTLMLRKSEIDKANKDKQHKVFSSEFRVSNIVS